MDIKVRDLRQTDIIENENKLMVLVDDDLNLVKNITKEEFLTNVISSTENNALVQETDGNLYVNTSEIADSVQALDDKFTEQIGDLSDLTTEDKTNLVAAINEAATKGGGGSTLFEFKWCDHLLNNISWLRADTFSWQSGDVYVTAYNHLLQDIQGITSETETIGSYTVTFYRATDGHKICLADQEQTVLNIYNTYGIAWYYILDTTNTQFKLPRTKYGFEGLRTNVGDKIDESLPNITGSLGSVVTGGGWNSQTFGAFTATQIESNVSSFASNAGNRTRYNLDASRSSSTYQDNAPVQERATQMYLYFYVGDYTQTAIEQTAGLNSELFNNKADRDFSNCTFMPMHSDVVHIVETYVNGSSWYRIYSDGWCEQGGKFVITTASVAGSSYNTATLTFLKPFNKCITYNVQAKHDRFNVGFQTEINGQALTQVVVYQANDSGTSFVNPYVIWQAGGYIS